MKNIILTLAFLIVAVLTIMAQRPPRLVSPEVHTDHSITFRYFSKTAQKVILNGEFLTEPVSLTNDGSGVWTVTVPQVKPDIYPYSFWEDSVQIADPNNMYIFAVFYHKSMS